MRVYGQLNVLMKGLRRTRVGQYWQPVQTQAKFQPFDLYLSIPIMTHSIWHDISLAGMSCTGNAEAQMLSQRYSGRHRTIACREQEYNCAYKHWR